MALPTTVVSEAGVAGYQPPLKSSGGNFYVVAKASGDTGIGVYKATDPTASWTEQNTAGNPARAVDAVSAVVSVVQNADEIHIVTITTALILEYHKFNMATDTWSVVDQQVADLTGMSTPSSTVLWCSIAYRSGATNELVVAASGIPDPDMGSNYERVDFWHKDKDATTWTGPVSLDASVADDHEFQPQLALGTNNRIHVFWRRDSVGDQPIGRVNEVAARTIRPDNTLGASSSLNLGFGVELLPQSNAVSYDSSGTQKVRILPHKTGAIYGADEDGSDDIGTIGLIGDATASTIFVNGEVVIHSLAVDGTDLHYVWSDSTQDLFHDSSTDGGATWGTDVEELDAVMVNYISANIYQRGSSLVIAYLYDDAGTAKYNEITLTIPSMTKLSDGKFGSLINSHVGPFEI